MIIRYVTEDDLTVCGEIYARAFAVPPYHERWTPEAATEMLAGVWERDPASCWCAAEDGRVLGMAFCTSFGTFRATIQEFAVDTPFQRQGIGTALLSHVLEEFKARGMRSVDLVVHQDAPAYRLYRKFGFHQPGRYALMIKMM